MRSRQEMKALAKDAMRQQRGTSILTYLVMTLVLAAVGFVAGIIGGIMMVVAVGFGLAVTYILTYAVIIFVGLPLMVNAEIVYIKIFGRVKASANELFSNFSVNYLRKVGGMLWMMLWTALWTLLLYIPGIVKGIAYSMTPLILADCPNVTARDALKLSMRMTNGHKMKLFVLNLSFIGWFMLSVLTLGILLFVYVMPYYYTVVAGYYIELRDKALAEGIISQEELYGRLQ